MTNRDLARSYLFKAQKRLKALSVLLEEEDYSDVVREAQELVELSIKAMLRYIGVEPPKQHEVSYLLVEHQDRLPPEVARALPELVRTSKWLRKEREFALCGDVDLIPTEEYTREDATRAMEDARAVVEVAKSLIEGTNP